MEISHPILEIGSLNIEAYDSLTVDRSLDSHSSVFSWNSFDHADPESAAGSAPWRLFTENIVRVSLAGDIVFTGYAEEIRPASSSKRHWVRVSGRSLTMDLVDSSPPTIDEPDNPPDDITIGNAVRRVNDGVGVVTYSAADIPRLTIPRTLPGQGERISGYIDRIAQQRQLITTDNRHGELVVMKAEDGDSLGVLEYGDPHLLETTGTFSTARTFDEYIVTGNIPPGEEDDGEPTYRIVASNDGNLFPGRKRRIRIPAPQLMKRADAQNWINHEAARSIAASYAIGAVVTGWRNERGELYDTGQIYELDSPHLLTEGRVKLMVGAVQYRHSTKGGQTAFLALSSPMAWVEGYIPPPPADTPSDPGARLSSLRERGRTRSGNNSSNAVGDRLSRQREQGRNR